MKIAYILESRYTESVEYMPCAVFDSEEKAKKYISKEIEREKKQGYGEIKSEAYKADYIGIVYEVGYTTKSGIFSYRVDAVEKL